MKLMHGYYCEACNLRWFQELWEQPGRCLSCSHLAVYTGSENRNEPEDYDSCSSPKSKRTKD